jgi:hypothetical protein
VNFIQKDLPPGSRTGAGFLKKPGSGALGMGQRASTGLTMCKFSYPVTFTTAKRIQSIPFGLTLHHSEERGWLMNTSAATSPSSTLTLLPLLVTFSSSSPLSLKLSSNLMLPSPSSPLVLSLWVSVQVASNRIFLLLSPNNTRIRKPTSASRRMVPRRLSILQLPQLVFV